MTIVTTKASSSRNHSKVTPKPPSTPGDAVPHLPQKKVAGRSSATPKKKIAPSVKTPPTSARRSLRGVKPAELANVHLVPERLETEETRNIASGLPSEQNETQVEAISIPRLDKGKQRMVYDDAPVEQTAHASEIGVTTELVPGRSSATPKNKKKIAPSAKAPSSARRSLRGVKPAESSNVHPVPERLDTGETRNISNGLPSEQNEMQVEAISIVPRPDKGKQRMVYEDVDEQTPEISIKAELVQEALAFAADPKGKKRAREEDEVETPKKRGRKSLKGDLPKIVKLKRAPGVKAKGNASTSKANASLKWKIFQPAEPEFTEKSTPLPEPTKLRPRMWTNNKKELLAMMPEMTGSTCVNGLSWKLYETPMLLLDEGNPCFQIDRTGKDILSLDLITTRTFVCPIPDRAELEKSKLIFIAPPPTAFVEPAPMEAPLEQKPKVHRRAPRYKSPRLNDGRSRGKGKTSQQIPVASDEIPAITIQLKPDGPEMPPIVMKLEPVEAPSQLGESKKVDEDPDNGDPDNARAREALPDEDMISPSTSSNTYILPRLPDRPLTSKDSGCIDLFLQAATKIIQVATYHPDASSDMNPGPEPSTHRPGMSASDELAAVTASSCVDDVGKEPAEIAFNPNPADAPLPVGAVESMETESMQESMKQFPKTNIHRPMDIALPAFENSASLDEIEDFADSDLIEIDPSPMELINASSMANAEQVLEYDGESPADLCYPGDVLPMSGAHVVMADESFDDMVLVKGEDLAAVMTEGMAGSSSNYMRMETDVGEPDYAEYIPSSLPEEVQVIIDSYICGRPITLLVSRQHMLNHWALNLPDEYGYTMLGYFRILGVQEILQSSDKSEDSLSGQVQWRFHLKWAPGGEDEVLPVAKNFDLDRAWWHPPTPQTSEPVGDVVPADQAMSHSVNKDDATDEPEEEFPTTTRYRDARMRHHEFKFRHDPLTGLYESILPMYMRVPFGPMYLDSSLPKGWLCENCGRMNFQAALRHRNCRSSFCKGKPPPVAPYAQDLAMMRDPQEQLPLSAPLNTYPTALVRSSIEKFEIGIQTFSYHLGNHEDVVIKHIFTSNAPPLQEEASMLLHDIQLNVPLLRPLAENSPYFSWSGKSRADITSPTDSKWPNIPDTMNAAKAFLVLRVRSFAGLTEAQLGITRLKVLGWITTGSKRGTDLIHAKTKSVVLCALGCTIVIVLYPRSLHGAAAIVDKAVVVRAGQSQGQEPVTAETEVAAAHEQPAAGWVVDADAEGDAEPEGDVEGDDAADEAVTLSPRKGRPPAKASKSSFSAMLMHGDILVLHGDDFEYSVKRDGTSMLLIASHDSA